MPVKNAASTLDASIISVLSQQSCEFELICVVTPTEDETLNIAKKWAKRDNRVKVIYDMNLQGVSDAANLGIDNASGEFIARCDGDDLNLPNRFIAQKSFLDNHKNVGVLGTDVVTFGKHETRWRLPRDHESIKATMLFRGALAHPTIMMRSSILKSNGIKYDEEFNVGTEDLDLYLKLIDLTEFRNLDYATVRYKISNSQTSVISAEKMLERASSLRLMQLIKLGVKVDAEKFSLHEKVAQNQPNIDTEALWNWFLEILDANDKNNLYARSALFTTLEREFYAANSDSSIAYSRQYRWQFLEILKNKIPLSLRIKIADAMF